MRTKLTPDHLRHVDLQEYYEDLQVTIGVFVESWEEDLEALEETRDELEAANEQVKLLTEKNETLEKKIKGRLKNGDLTIRTARKASKYPCRNCGKLIAVGDEYIQRTEYAPHQERWNYTHWHTRCPR